MENQCVYDEDVSRRVERPHDGLDQCHSEIHDAEQVSMLVSSVGWCNRGNGYIDRI